MRTIIIPAFRRYASEEIGTGNIKSGGTHMFTINKTPKFKLGQLLVTSGVQELLENGYAEEVNVALNRYVAEDWGVLDWEDQKMNDLAVATGESRILAKYKIGDEYIYIITEWDRSYTTILLPEEY